MNTDKTCTECGNWDPVDGKCAIDGDYYHGWETACDEFAEESDTRWSISHEDGYERRVLWVEDPDAAATLAAMQKMIESGWNDYGPNMAMYNIHWNDDAKRIEATDGKHLLVWTDPPKNLTERFGDCPAWSFSKDIGLISCPDLSDYHYPDTSKVIGQAESREFRDTNFIHSVYPDPYRHIWLINQAALHFRKILGPKLTSRIEPVADMFTECASGPKPSDPVVFRNKERGLLYIINPIVTGA